jgi:hypothetical protein
MMIDTVGGWFGLDVKWVVGLLIVHAGIMKF